MPKISKTGTSSVHTFSFPAPYGTYSFLETGSNATSLSYNAIGTIVKTIVPFPTLNYPNLKDDLFPFAPKPNLDWTKGLLLQKEYYNEAGELLMKEENQYDLKNVTKIPGLKVISDAQDPGKVEDPFNQSSLSYALAKYYVLVGDKRIHKTIVTNYFKDVNNALLSVKQETNFVYNASVGVHHKPIEINFKNSDGKIHRTKIYYAQDMPLNHPNFSSKQVFLDKFMIGVPLQVESCFGDDTKKKGSVLEYKDYGTDKKRFLPFKFYTINSDATKALNVTIDDYTSDGRPMKFTKVGYTTSELYTWDKELLKKREFGTGTNKLTSEFMYNTNRLLTLITDENGQKSKFTYDPLLRAKTIESKFSDIVNATSPNVLVDIAYNFKTTTGDNFIKNMTTFKESTGNVILADRQLFDGLGRNIQVIKEAYSAPSASKNINQNSTIYDIAGRPLKNYQPFESTVTNYSIPTATISFTSTQYEGSPLSRVLSITNVDNTVVKKIYGTNTSSEVIDFTTNSSGTTFFAANVLLKEEVINENGDKTAIFKDLAGRSILTRRYTKSGASPNYSYSTYADTYNVFDTWDNLVAIVPPGESNATTNQCFKYQYDLKHRLFKKSIPATEGFYTYHYNDRDMLAITQDPNQAAASTPKCIFTKYDEIGRPSEVGLINYPTANITLATNTVNNTVSIPNADLLQWNVYASNKDRLLQESVRAGATFINYNYSYDTYNRVSKKMFIDPNGRAEEINTEYNFADKVTKVIRKHTDPVGIQHTITDRYTYDHGLRTKSHFHKYDNLPETQVSRKEYTYKDELSELNLGVNANPLLTPRQLQSVDYQYNTRGWLTGINKNNTGMISLANQYYYQCGNNYAPTSPVAAPVNGEDNAPDAFMMELFYNEKDNGYLGSTKQYNGNIQAVQYQVYGVDRQSYGYTYDNLDRMTRAQYGFLDNNNTLTFNSRYNEILSYDTRGNITTLKRNGTSGTCIISNPANPAQQIPVFSFAPIDNLTYTYNTTHKNRLEKIDETALTNYGFKVKAGVNQTSAKYEYDKNGNLIKDPFKGIVGIAYNHLNLPTFIAFQDDVSRNEITITYDAKGQKWSKKTETLRKVNTTPISWQSLSNNTYYYDNGIEYRNNNAVQPDILQIDEGRLVWTMGMTAGTGSYKYEYALRDHLGNTRVMISDKNANGRIEPNTEITQVNHYYPFGMNQDGPWLAGNNGDQKYQYNGKELNTDFGLDLTDYSKRWYDAATARFVSVDGLAEKFPYNGVFNYAENRPVNGVDLDGQEWIHYQQGGLNVINVNVSAEYYGTTLTQKEFTNYMNVVSAEYTRILETSSGGFYTGILSFNSENEYTGKTWMPRMTIGDYGSINEVGTYIPGMEGNGGSDLRILDRNRNLQSSKDFALDFIHELMHTARIGHPFDITNALDCELTKCGDGRSFSTTSNTDPNIHDNLMLYNINNLNGVSLFERWQVKQGDRLTPGQLNYLKNQVKMQMGGKGSKGENDADYWSIEKTGESLETENE